MSRYGSNANAEMQQFVQQQQQNAALKQVINKLTDKCWDMCVGKIGSSLSSREASCLSQCSQRFADVSEFMVKRAIQKQKQGGM